MKSKRNFLLSGFLLTLAALLMRTISVSFNVYVSGLVGAEAMGLLALIAGVYGFAVTLATSGIHSSCHGAHGFGAPCANGRS